MQWLNRLFKFYLDASIHVALALMSLVLVTFIYFGLDINWEVSLFLFLTTIASYNFIKYGVEAEKYIIVSNKYHRVIQVFSFLAMIPALYLALSINLQVWLLLGILTVLVVLYAIPILPKEKTFRTWGMVKVMIVALVWAGITVVLPILSVDAPLDFDVWIETAQRFLFVLVLMIPFEIRDLEFDKPNLGTLPQKMGIRRTKQLGYLIVFIALILTYFKDDIYQAEPFQKSIIFGILILLVAYSEVSRKPVYSAFWVEGLPILWAAFVFLTRDLRLLP